AVFAWLVVEVRREQDRLRPLVAYVVAGIVTVGVLLLPFFLVAGTKMIRIIIFDQIGRGGSRVPLGERLRVMEGIRASAPIPDVLVGAVFVAAVALVLFGAWRRPAIRPWVWILAAQTALLLVTPSFFRHYAAWFAAVASLSIGSSVAILAGWAAGREAPTADEPRRTGDEPGRPEADATSGVPVRPGSGVVGVAYAVVLAGLLVIAAIPGTGGFGNPSGRFPSARIAAAFAGARCPTGDSASLLILTGLLRRMLDNGCPVLVSPTGVSYDTDRELRGPARSRKNQPEYQAIMAAYYGGSDGAAFIRREGNNGLTDQTLATIRGRLPVTQSIDKVTIYLPAGH
ncbi:MAG TPA: hypothetical protein VFS32_09165, partial [Candidatus Limnocylindrales bacterium]|nr:hypothetical protein [Candidatus Limnocylindrales bacterium]